MGLALLPNKICMQTCVCFDRSGMTTMNSRRTRSKKVHQRLEARHELGYLVSDALELRSACRDLDRDGCVTALSLPLLTGAFRHRAARGFAVFPFSFDVCLSGWFDPRISFSSMCQRALAKSRRGSPMHVPVARERSRRLRIDRSMAVVPDPVYAKNLGGRSVWIDLTQRDHVHISQKLQSKSRMLPAPQRPVRFPRTSHDTALPCTGALDGHESMLA
jgi:hypothetical protein